MKTFRTIILLLLAATAVMATAQDSFDRYCAKVQILQDRRVQNEVGITEAQRKKMNEFAAAHQKKLQAYQQSLAGKTPDMKVLQGYMTDLNKKVLTVLTGPEIIRLRQLNLQAAGLSGLADEVIAKKIGMTSAQLTKFRTTLQTGQVAVAKILQNAIAPIQKRYEPKVAVYKGHEKDHVKELQGLQKAYYEEATAAQQRVKPQVTAITKQTEAKLQAIITPAQKATWIALQGKKFTLK